MNDVARPWRVVGGHHLAPAGSDYAYIRAQLDPEDVMRRLLGTSALVVGFVACPVSSALAQSAEGTGSIVGRVTDEQQRPVAGARASIGGLSLDPITDASGRFVRSGLAPGEYLVVVRRIGYHPSEVRRVVVTAGQTSEVDIVLALAAVPLSRIVVAPGHYQALDVTAPSQQALERTEILTRPQLGEDLFRSLNRLPGFSGSDFSAKLRVRNAAQDELLVLFDGMELLEPFHLKDLDGALSVVDAEAIGGVDVSTGGFGAALGGRSGGVIQMRSTRPGELGSRSAAGVSLTNVRVRSEGRFAGERGAWSLSARRGFLDLVFRLTGDEDAPDPTYFDATGKVQYRIADRHLVTSQFLVAGDGLQYSEDNGATFLRSRYDNAYTWATVKSDWTASLRSTTLVSLSHLAWERAGEEGEALSGIPFRRAQIRDNRALTAVGAKQDWTWDASERLSVAVGAELRHERSDLDYDRWTRAPTGSGSGTPSVDSIRVRRQLSPTGTRSAVYAATRVRPWLRVVSEFGVRADRQTWTGQSTVSPRASASIDLSPRTTVRGAWGLYSQAQGLHELSVIDGESTFAPVERAEHRVVSLEQRMGLRWNWRSEAFDRVVRSPRPRYYNLDGTIDIFPDVAFDRVRLAPRRVHVRGVETTVGYRGDRLDASASYTLSKATADYSSGTFVRPYDERHAFAADLAWRTANGWTLASSWTAHSGWPTERPVFTVSTDAGTAPVIRRQPGSPDLSDRLDGYHRLDVRASRTFRQSSGRSVGLFLDLLNVLGTANQRGTVYTPQLINGALHVSQERSDFLPRLPSFGVRFDF